MRIHLISILALCLLGGGAALADDAEPTVTFRFSDAPVREVITSIARHAKANIIIPQDLEGKITLSLHEVPWRAALEQVVRIAGCELKEEEGGILRVVRPKAVEKVVRVYDVSDLRANAPQADAKAPDVDYLPAVIAPKNSGEMEITFDDEKRVLIVRAAPELQERFAKALAELRTKTAEDGRFHLEGLEVGYADAKARLGDFEELKEYAGRRNPDPELEARKEAAMSAKLEAQLAVLRAELSALRTELAEIKAILLSEKR